MSQFVFKIGPLEGQDKVEDAYFVYPGRKDAEVFFAASRHEAAVAIKDAYPETPLQCEPELAAAGFNAIPAAEWTDQRRHILALTALEMVSRETFAEIEAEGLIYQFGRAAAAYWAAAPWRTEAGQMLQTLTMTEPSHETFVGAVLGAGGKEFGLAIYRDRGDAEAAAGCVDLGLEKLAAAVDTVGVTFLADPACGVDAMRRAHGLSRIPLPLCTADGSRRPIRDPDIALITAAMYALAAVTEGRQPYTGQVTVGDIRCQLVAGMPSPAD